MELTGKGVPVAAAADGATATDTISVIIPVAAELAGPAEAYRAYRQALEGQALRVEFIYVLARHASRTLAELTRLKDAGEPLTLVVLSRWDGEGTALRSAFRYARGGIIMTLPARLEVAPDDLPEVLQALAGCDMVVARRRRAQATRTRVEGLQARVFHWLIRRLFGFDFSDLPCRVRACHRRVLEEVVGYGVRHQFLPLLAAERGFRIREVEVRAASATSARAGGVFGRIAPLARIRLILDVLALYVVLKFIRKPLRFFGAIGLPILFVGTAYTGALGLARLFFGVGLADRPALLLGVLLIVLGLQIIALGLIGEIVIFASGKRLKDYTVDKVL